MKTLGKLLGILLLVVIVVLASAAVYVTQFLDPNDYKEEIRQLALEQANLDLQIDGEIGWSLFPWLGLELTDTRLGRPQQPQFASVDRLGLSVRALPLLRKDIRMSGIRLDGLELDLIVDAQGQPNWQAPDNTNAASPATTPQDETPASSQSGSTSQKTHKPLQLDIESLTLHNARIQYQDLKNQQSFSLDNIQLETGAIAPGQDFSLKLSGFLASNTPLLRAKAQLNGTAFMHENGQLLRLSAFDLNSEVAGDPLAGKSADIQLTGSLELDLSRQHATLSSLKLDFNQLQAMADLELDLAAADTGLQGRLSTAPLKLRPFLASLGVELPADLPASALQQLELSGTLTGSLAAPKLTDANIQLDQSHFTGELGSSNLEQQAFYLHLQGDQLNLDNYLGSADQPAAPSSNKPATTGSGSSAAKPAASSGIWSSEPLIPADALRDLNVEARLNMEQLTLSGLPLQKVRLDLLARNNQLNIRNYSAGLYGGQLDGNARLNLARQPATLNLHSKIRQLPIARVAQQLGEPLPISGNLQLDGDLTTSGNSERDWISNLGGSLKLQLLNGILHDSNLEQQLCMGIATLNRKPLTQSKKATNTPFTRLTTSASLKRGVAHTPDLRIAIPGLQVKGKGDLDLNRMHMDYRLGVILEGDTRAMPDPACTINKRYVGLEVPVRCQGPLDAAADSCSIDQDGVSKLLSRLAGDKLSEKLEEKLQDKLKDKVSPDLQDALKGLFKR